MFGGETGKWLSCFVHPLSTTRAYSNFTRETYAVGNCRQPVRVRVNHIHFDNAGVERGIL